ncbi:MAG: GIY-YIG nuclease family protein [Lachnospiraceae bacterium]|nr:GIY-YIG nuclease family protein [Lachnospiraceae bacterium]
MSNGLVYILTNPCLDGWVKIGMTQRNDIERRLQELNSPTNILLSYRCYATYEVDNPAEVEKRIHSIIDRIENAEFD